MKVVFLTDSLSDLDGVGRYSVRLISALEALRPDLEVHVLLARKHRPTSADVPSHWRVEVALPPDYFFYMTPSRFRVWRWLGTWRTRRALRGASLVHAIKDYPHSLIGVDAAERAGIPCVATGHGTYTIQPVKADGPHRARALDAYSRFAAMISVSRYTRRRLLEIVPAETLPPERVHVVPNAVSAAHYAEPRALEGVLWEGMRFTLGIGEVKERKGHHLAVAAWAKAARTAARPASRPGGQQDRGRLRALPRRAGSRGGRRGSAAPGGEHRRGREGRPASARRGLPAHAGHGGGRRLRGLRHRLPGGGGGRTPSIGSLDSGAEDAIVDGETGLLVEQDVDGVGAALVSLLDDPDRRARLAEGGLAHAARSSWTDNARDVLEIYDAVLGGGQG